MRIIHEDSELLAVDKPAGRPVIPGRGAAGAPLNRELEEALGRTLFVVHRLDRHASGLVLFAKTAAAHARLCALFERRLIRKTYLALVDGALSGAGEIDAPLKEFGSGRVGVGAPGKASLTRYEPLAGGRGCTLVEARPVTGRRHQLRAHFYSIGHPILGDPLYGSPRPVGGEPRLMLHASALAAEGLGSLSCPPSEDFLSVLERRGCRWNGGLSAS